MTDFLLRPGVVCGACGSPELRVIVPGSDGDACGMIVLRRPVADRGWCCTDHARQAQLPFLTAERASWEIAPDQGDIERALVVHSAPDGHSAEVVF